MTNTQLEITSSSGNIFEDLELKDSPQRLAKAELASRINDIIDERGLTQREAGKLLGINQPKVSELMNGRLKRFSMEKLLTFLTLLDQDIKIVIKDKPSSKRHHEKLMIAFA